MRINCLVTAIALMTALFLLAVNATAQEAAEAQVPDGGPQVTGQVTEPEAAADPETGMEAEAIEDNPLPDGPDLHTPVFVVHEGDDALGARLAFQVKEIFNTASLFDLNSEDVRKIRVLIKTRSEFPGRPNLGSIYSVTWIYQASENMLAHYLDGELGFIPADGVESLAEELAARTEKVSTRYSYLFE